MMHAVEQAGKSGLFQGLSWDYFLADVELEARAARRKMRDNELVDRRQAKSRPLPFKVPGPEARRFGGRLADSAYIYEHFHLRLGFNAWKRERGCGTDFPRCCEPQSPVDRRGQSVFAFASLKLRRTRFALQSRVAAPREARSLVPRGGIEPPTLRFSVACSTN